MLLKLKEWFLASNPEPSYLEKMLVFLYDLFYFVRVQKPVTALFGTMYHRSQDLIELDITYSCNLKCYSCNRSCGLAPSDDQLSLGQVRGFIRESIENNVRWKKIRLLGGEPTTHPQLSELVQELAAYRSEYCPETIIELVSNGVGNSYTDARAKLGDVIRIINTSKTSRSNPFLAFNVAPRDLALYSYADYSCGCWVPEFCGINFSPYGYYCCGAGAGIDRVFGFDIGRKSLPETADSLRDQMDVLCRYCIHFKATRRRRISGEQISPSWRKALEVYTAGKPKITLY